MSAFFPRLSLASSGCKCITREILCNCFPWRSEWPQLHLGLARLQTGPEEVEEEMEGYEGEFQVLGLG